MSSPGLAERIAARWRALSTGLKMFLILGLGLLPLGVIAIAASIQNASDNRSRGEAEATAMLAVHVQRLTLPLARHAFTIRAGRDAILASGAQPVEACTRTLDRLRRLPGSGGRYALFGPAGQLSCASAGYLVPTVPAAAGENARVDLAQNGQLLRIFLYDSAGSPEGIFEFERDTLASLVNEPPLAGDFGIELVQGTNEMPLRIAPPARATADEIVVTHPLANGQYALRVHAPASPLTLSDVLIILTPLLMWLWASAIGWFLVDRLLLAPLKRMEGAISRYRPGDTLPTVRSPAREIAALGDAFDTMTRTVARHEADLEAGLERQRLLVREVHHRVKNNLQVVASLLNIHSRGARDDSAAAAYASIQRRVDALAVVHRNHFAELEDTYGVALRPLVSELAANLRASAPGHGNRMQIQHDVDPLHVGQDIAVSIAFLITEIAEFGILCGARAVSIVVERQTAEVALLAIDVDIPPGALSCDQAVIDRFERVVTGLARQLRAPLERDTEARRYAITIPVIKADGNGGDAAG